MFSEIVVKQQQVCIEVHDPDSKCVPMLFSGYLLFQLQG